MSQAVTTFKAELRSVGMARRFVQETLESWDLDQFLNEATLCVTELATNSVIHARTEFAVTLRCDDLRLRLAVQDGSSVRPIAKARSIQATTGRGLLLVEANVDQWGVTAQPNAKTVWCEWDLRPSLGLTQRSASEDLTSTARGVPSDQAAPLGDASAPKDHARPAIDRAA